MSGWYLVLVSAAEALGSQAGESLLLCQLDPGCLHAIHRVRWVRRKMTELRGTKVGLGQLRKS